MNTRISLEQIRIAEPCQVPLANMPGDDRARFCTFCQKHVHNLSAMSRTEAEKLVCESGGDLCVMYHPDANGAPLTLEYASTRPSRSFWQRYWPVACLAALAAGVLSFVKKPAPQPIMAGFMLAPTQMPTAPADPSGSSEPTSPDVHFKS